jgi:predicted DsbA family dithiol-disulfide isomerase
MAATRTLKVDVTSDYLCPFCLLGMRQLELAIEKYRERDHEPFNVEICMRPFQLNGLISETPMQRSEYGEKKFGADRWNCVCDSLAAKFKSVGIDYKTDGAMSQSHLAHRLTEYAGQLKPESQLAVSMDIFDLYHVNGVHLSDREGLAEIGVKHGLFSDKDGGLAWLAGNACDLEVKKQYQTAQRMGITGVPFFVFQDKYAASGAMGVDEFVEILADINKREKDTSASPPVFQSGEQCPIQTGGGHVPPAPQPAAATAAR